MTDSTLRNDKKLLLGTAVLCGVMGIVGARLGTALALGSFSPDSTGGEAFLYSPVAVIAGGLAALPWLIVYAIMVFRGIPHRPWLHVAGAILCAALSTGILAYIYAPMVSRPWR
jgi:hypothetical protein